MGAETANSTVELTSLGIAWLAVPWVSVDCCESMLCNPCNHCVDADHLNVVANEILAQCIRTA